MSFGAAQSGNIINGAFDPTKANYFCGDCRSYVQAPGDAPGVRECPTPGCTRPTGFGAFWNVPRPARRGNVAPRRPG